MQVTDKNMTGLVSRLCTWAMKFLVLPIEKKKHSRRTPSSICSCFSRHQCNCVHVHSLEREAVTDAPDPQPPSRPFALNRQTTKERPLCSRQLKEISQGSPHTRPSGQPAMPCFWRGSALLYNNLPFNPE
ncbi:hypothetical protein FJTKL_01160 [Diaporthe vaccinii]|uniref:Uncharacterized protein n=1 Tax=Diaporthe vaccinii TaxID=105482 RepID=A0ABR4F595_9PEZI